MTEAGQEFRRSCRNALAMPARCRTLGGFVEDVVIRDVSPEGCRVFGSALNISAGMQVVIRPAGMEGLSAIVRWASRTDAGLEFDRPLHPAVADHMHRSYATFLPPERPGRPAMAPPRAA